MARPILSYDDIPRELNLATYFVDRHVEEGRGDRTALIRPGGETSYAELAALVNRSGNVLRELGARAEERVLLVLADSVEFVALWYGAQKIGAVTAEAYTFLPAKDYAYYLDYTRAGVVVADTTTVERVREAAEGSRWLRHLLVVGDSFEQLAAQASDELEPAPTTKDDVAIWKFTTGSTGQPKAAVHPQHSPLLSFDWYARGVLDMREDDVVLPVPKLFFGYARDLAALYPFGVGAAGIVFPERTTPERIFELVERHRPTILVQVPTMMAAMVAHPEAAAARPLLPAPLHVGRRGAAARAVRALAHDLRRRGARRDRLLRGVPHLHLEPARPRQAGQHRRAGPGLRARTSARTASSRSRATPPRSCTGASTRRRSRPSAATRSGPATCSSGMRTGSSGTAAARTT